MKVFDWFIKNKLKAIVLAVLGFVLPLLVVHLLYKLNIGLVWLHTAWTAGDILTYIAGFEALCGTVILGLVSIYQNKAAQQANERISRENNSFIDHGKPYDPLAKKGPDISLPAEDRPIGGLGVFLVKKTMDDVSYEYKNGRNILRIKKHLS